VVFASPLFKEYLSSHIPSYWLAFLMFIALPKVSLTSGSKFYRITQAYQPFNKVISLLDKAPSYSIIGIF
jgi:hypothetical protein